MLYPKQIDLSEANRTWRFLNLSSLFLTIINLILASVTEKCPSNVCDNPLQTNDISLETYHHQELILASKKHQKHIDF